MHYYDSLQKVRCLMWFDCNEALRELKDISSIISGHHDMRDLGFLVGISNDSIWLGINGQTKSSLIRVSDECVDFLVNQGPLADVHSDLAVKIFGRAENGIVVEVVAVWRIFLVGVSDLAREI